jgi:hypothetical protein
MLRLDLPCHHPCCGSGADDQDPLFELARVRQPVEEQPPGDDRDQEDDERRDEDSVADGDGRDEQVEQRHQNRRRAAGLQEADEQLTARMDDCEVVEVVVVEAELTQAGDQRDLPHVVRHVRPGPMCARGDRHGPEDQQDLAAEDRQTARRHIPVEQLHP